jgi:hypothetical protein
MAYLLVLRTQTLFDYASLLRKQVPNAIQDRQINVSKLRSNSFHRFFCGFSGGHSAVL